MWIGLPVGAALALAQVWFTVRAVRARGARRVFFFACMTALIVAVLAITFWVSVRAVLAAAATAAVLSLVFMAVAVFKLKV